MWWCCWPKSQHSRSLGEKTAGGWTKFAFQISSISWPWHGAERLLHAPVHPSPARWHTGDSKQHHEPPQSPPHPSPPLGFKQPLFPFWGGAGGLLTGDPWHPLQQGAHSPQATIGTDSIPGRWDLGTFVQHLLQFLHPVGLTLSLGGCTQMSQQPPVFGAGKRSGGEGETEAQGCSAVP